MARKKKRFKKSRRFEQKIQRSKLDLHPQTRRAIWGILLFTLAIIIVLSFFNLGGTAGAYVKLLSYRFLGKGSVLAPLVLIVSSLIFLMSLRRNVYFSTIAGGVIFLLSILGIIEVLGKDNQWGGALGYIIALPLRIFLGFWGALVVFGAFLTISVLIMLNIPLGRRAVKEKEILRVKEGVEVLPFETQTRGLGALVKKIIPKPHFKTKPITEIRLEEAQKISLPTLKDKKFFLEGEEDSFTKPYRLRHKKLPLDLLEPDRGEPTSGDIRANSNIIKRTLQNFGIEVEMGEVNIGPTVTQYTLKPAEGVKLSKITVLANDLSLALASHPLRIEAPIPGRSLVGIEIPNKQVKFVRLRNLLENPLFSKSPSNLTFTLGRDVAGDAKFADLEKMPHLLIAGSTGSGKTICLNSLTLSLLYRNSPEFLRFILIDPKRVEFSVYNGIPHLLTPAIMDAQKTINALRWLVSEMERRFEVLSKAKARDIQAYNSEILRKRENKSVSIRDEEEIPLPYIVIIIDELADLMSARPREVEASIVRLAQMARAVGIHLVVATQRPSVEVITGLIKANITSRIAFQVASQVDSRTILDMAGAEKLLGNGDMLFISAETSKPRRIQGAYVSDKEIKRITDYLKKEQPEEALPDYEEEIVEGKEVSKEDLERLDEFDYQEGQDPLYEEAKKVVMRAQKASASLLQRRLSIGYARAARLLDMMEEEGLVGPVDGAKPREVYIRGEEDKEADEGL